MLGFASSSSERNEINDAISQSNFGKNYLLTLKKKRKTSKPVARRVREKNYLGEKKQVTFETTDTGVLFEKRAVVNDLYFGYQFDELSKYTMQKYLEEEPEKFIHVNAK